MTLRYVAPTSIDAAVELIGRGDARAIAGGTDLLVAMESGLDSAGTLVDIARGAAPSGMTWLGDGALRIGAATHLDTIADDSLVAEKFSALALAAAAVGTPALRAMGTIGGNLCQRPRCWYVRSRIPCLKNGGTGCPAKTGENQHHAILSAGPCHAAHPSDVAVALLALDATVIVRGTKGSRRVSIDALYANAASDPKSEVALESGEIIEAVELPAASSGGRQTFTKLMQRGAWDFALVSLAGIKRTDGNVRIALGGVAPMPYRVNPSVEEDVSSGELDQDSVDALAERALYDAEPLEMNGYKVQQAAALLKRAMLDLARVSATRAFPVAGVIVGAGAGKRFGGPKANAKLSSGQRFIDAVCETAHNAGLSPLIVVLPPDVAAPKGTTAVVNAKPEGEQVVSIRLGLTQLANHPVDGAVVWPVDHPFVTLESMLAVLDTARRTGARIVAPEFDGEHGHPVFFHRDTWRELLTVPDGGAREVVHADPSRVAYVTVRDRGVLRDIDTQGDLAE